MIGMGDLEHAPHDGGDEVRRPREEEMPHLMKPERDAVEDRPPRGITELDREDVDEEQQQDCARNPHAAMAPVTGVFECRVEERWRRRFRRRFNVTHQLDMREPRNKPATLKSSSSQGQLMYSPSPISRKSARSAADA
jgi:hypothetical protein